ncbi:HNH endonuclease [Geopseudomonas aromaticivorans]
MHEASSLRNCLRPPITEIEDAARFLDAAVSAHLQGRRDIAEELIRFANSRAIWEWTDSIWGKNSQYVQYRHIPTAPPTLPKEQRIKVRMPNSAEKLHIHARDGYHCRFCGIPVIRREVRQLIAAAYPDVLPWGSTNDSQHAAFQAMWAQYDHVLPHARGGNNDIENVVLTCSACNFGRMSYTLEEVGLLDPRQREPRRSSWDGLERFQ